MSVALRSMVKFWLIFKSSLAIRLAPYPRTGLKIERIVHRGVVEVNEVGINIPNSAIRTSPLNSPSRNPIPSIRSAWGSSKTSKSDGELTPATKMDGEGASFKFNMVCDHPFQFHIVQRSTGNRVYVGQVNAPGLGVLPKRPASPGFESFSSVQNPSSPSPVQREQSSSFPELPSSRKMILSVPSPIKSMLNKPPNKTASPTATRLQSSSNLHLDEHHYEPVSAWKERKNDT